jgi:pilus assembly protein Flp/PilA
MDGESAIFPCEMVIPRRASSRYETAVMKKEFLRSCIRLQYLTQTLIRDERGQDLIEYALLVGLLAMGATASISTLAGSFSTAFSKIGSKLSTYSS